MKHNKVVFVVYMSNHIKICKGLCTCRARIKQGKEFSCDFVE